MADIAVLKYRDPATGSWVPILHGSIPIEGGGELEILSAVVAGNGLTGGGSTIPTSTINVGAGGNQITVGANDISLNTACTTITDWNDATTNGWFRGNNAVNGPSTFATGWWYGWTVVYSTNWITQFALPFSQAGIDHNALMWRHCFSGVWDVWGRVNNYVYAWDYLDNFVTLRWGGNSSNAQYGITRFAMGTKTATNAATASDAWRVQCYDTGGDFSWTGIQMPESGAVSFPKGHSLLRQAMVAREAVPADQAATVGMVAEMIANALAGSGLLREGVDARQVTGLLIGEPSDPTADPGATDG